MKIFIPLLASLLILSLSPLAQADWSQTLSQYNCLEVEVFQVERAAAAPEEGLYRLQQKIVTVLQEKKTMSEVNQANRPPCSAKALVVGGKISDYQVGNVAVHVFVGFGTGSDKIVAETYIKDKLTGNVLVKKRIAETATPPVGGIEPAVEKQFAKNVAAFVELGK